MNKLVLRWRQYLVGEVMSRDFAVYGTFEWQDSTDQEASWVATAPAIDGIKDAIGRFQSAEPREPSYPHEEKIDIASEVGRGIWHFYSQLKSYYEVAAVTDMVPRAFANGFFKKTIAGHAIDNFEVVETYKNIPIYGLSEIDFIYINRQIEKWNSISSGFEKLPASILLSLVAGFDYAFADFAKVLLRSRPERYEGSDRQYSISDIIKLSSIEELIEKAADDEIDSLMNKSHAEQIAFFEKSFNISIRKHYERWPQFMEIFERRNLAAHGNLRVNERYLENCREAGLECKNRIGDILIVDKGYLESSIDILVEFGILLALSAWQKQFPRSVLESFGAVVEVSYSLLKDDHPQVAARLLEYGLKVKSKGADEEKTKMMIINLAIAYKQCGEAGESSKVLSETDWSASPPQFKLCAAAIREDIEEASSLLQAARVSDGLSLHEIREWPAFQWIRKNDEFRLSCERVFGEPLLPTSIVKEQEATSENPREQGDDKESDPGT